MLLSISLALLSLEEVFFSKNAEDNTIEISNKRVENISDKPATSLAKLLSESSNLRKTLIVNNNDGRKNIKSRAKKDKTNKKSKKNFPAKEEAIAEMVVVPICVTHFSLNFLIEGRKA